MLVLVVTFPEGSKPRFLLNILFIQHLHHDARMLTSQIILIMKMIISINCLHSMLNCRRQRSSKSTTLRSTATDDHHETMNFYNLVNPHAEGFWLLEIYSANVANPLYSSRAKKKKLKQNTAMRQTNYFLQKYNNHYSSFW